MHAHRKPYYLDAFVKAENFVKAAKNLIVSRERGRTQWIRQRDISSASDIVWEDEVQALAESCFVFCRYLEVVTWSVVR